MNIEQIREDFPHINEKIIYFNHASLGPISKSVHGRVEEYMTQRMHKKIKNYDDYLTAEASAKNKLATLLNVNSGSIAWTDSVSRAFSTLANGIDWKAGDRILLNDIEFPANVYPFLNLKDLGVEVDFVKSVNGTIPVERIADCITPKTRLVSISAVQFYSGYRADLKSIGALCSERNIIFSVDGFQGVGVVKIDPVECNIDFLAGGTQKWLMGLQGLSYFYISNKLKDNLNVPDVGWNSYKTAWELLNYDTELKADAERFNAGTQNCLAITALDESLTKFVESGIENIENRVVENSLYLADKLKDSGLSTFIPELNKTNIAGIVTVNVDDSDYLKDELKKANIFVESREGKLRISPHFYNTKGEIDEFIVVLKSIMK